MLGESGMSVLRFVPRAHRARRHSLFELDPRLLRGPAAPDRTGRPHEFAVFAVNGATAEHLTIRVRAADAYHARELAKSRLTEVGRVASDFEIGLAVVCPEVERQSDLFQQLFVAYWRWMWFRF
jgi:hypothetical protein